MTQERRSPLRSTSSIPDFVCRHAHPVVQCCFTVLPAQDGFGKSVRATTKKISGSEQTMLFGIRAAERT
jgi:hypothetical protein